MSCADCSLHVPCEFPGCTNVAKHWAMINHDTSEDRCCEHIRCNEHGELWVRQKDPIRAISVKSICSNHHYCLWNTLQLPCDLYIQNHHACGCVTSVDRVHARNAVKVSKQCKTHGGGAERNFFPGIWNPGMAALHRWYCLENDRIHIASLQNKDLSR